ncbi:MAG: aminotransferase class IV [Planctomycetota bacterium]|jgi:branched-chain amino acid aminotransferase|nr:aminotransferase class IV [Planctomycetota bacterium]
MSITVNINGTFFPPEKSQISIFDHGFLFGDSVYEVVRTFGGVPFAVQPHFLRLLQSARRIGLQLPDSATHLGREVLRTIRRSELPECMVRIVITRGAGAPRIDPSTCSSPNSILILQPIPNPSDSEDQKSPDLVIVDIERNSRRSTDPRIKSGNYLNNVLALMEANQRGACEGIMKNAQGHLTEGTTSNIFFICDGTLHTPALSCGILSGITRDLVLNLARTLSIPIKEGNFTPDQLESAQEVFITSTTRDILPIRTLQGAPYPEPFPGPVTQRLLEQFQIVVQSFRSEYPDLDHFESRLNTLLKKEDLW